MKILILGGTGVIIGAALYGWVKIRRWWRQPTLYPTSKGMDTLRHRRVGTDGAIIDTRKGK